MLIIHHLEESQSDRIIWLMEELGLPYELVRHERGPDRLMPPSYEALHPAATAPVVEDGERVLTESAAIVDYICHRYAGGELTVRPSQPGYFDYLYWMQLNNNLTGLLIGRRALAGRKDARLDRLLSRRAEGYARYMEQTLEVWPYLAGDDFTCADLMCVHSYRFRKALGQSKDLPHSRAWFERVTQRPAHIRAMEVAWPGGGPPEDIA